MAIAVWSYGVYAEAAADETEPACRQGGISTTCPASAGAERTGRWLQLFIQFYNLKI